MSSRARGRPLLGGLGLGYLNTVLVTLVGLWLTPFLLRRLGQDQYGLWLLGAQILMYLGLMDLGVVAVLPREVAYATGRAGGYQQADDLPALVGNTARLMLWQTPFVAVAALVAWRLVPASWGSLVWPLSLVVAAFVIQFPLRVFHAVLVGLQDLPFVGATQLTAWAVGTCVTVSLVWFGWGLYALAVGWIATQGLTAAVLRWRLRHRFTAVFPTRLPKLSPSAAKRQLGKGVWVSLSQVAQVLLSGTDLMVIGRMLGPSAVVPYACTAKLVLLLANQPSLLMEMASPALSELRAGGSRPRLFNASSALSQMMLLGSGCVACVVLAVNHGFVAWWVGSARFGGSLLTGLLLAGMLLRHLNVTASYTLFCFGYERRLAITGVSDGLVTLASSVLLVRLLGAPGAILGSIVGVVLVSLPVNLTTLAREDGVTLVGLLRPLAPWLWRFGLLAVVAAVCSMLWTPATFFALAATGAAAAGAYLALMLPLLARPPLRNYVMPRLAPLVTRLARGIGRPAGPAISESAIG